MTAEEREEKLREIHAIAEAVRKGQKDDGVVMLYDADTKFSIEAISTGSLLLDKALGCGGFPRGTVVELFGEESGGKSSIALSTVAQAQKQDIVCAYIDSENALDPRHARTLGVDMSMLLISQENCTETVFNTVDALIDNGVKLIIVDSIASVAPRSELEGAIGEIPIGLNARLIGQAMRDLAKKARASNTTLILINQIREKIGVFFGNNETTPGGRAIKFHATIRLDVRSRTRIKDGNEVVGVQIRAYVAKNKVAPPFKQATLDFFFKSGFDNELAVFDMAVDTGVIKRKGKSGYYVWDADGDASKLRKAWADYLREHPDKFKLLIDGVTESD